MNKWRWEVYFVGRVSGIMHTFISKQYFATIKAAHLNLMWNVNSGALDKHFSPESYNLVDVVFHLQEGGDDV